MKKQISNLFFKMMLTLALLLFAVPAISVSATEDVQYYVNPAYAEEYSVEQIKDMLADVEADEDEVLTGSTVLASDEQVIAFVKQKLKERAAGFDFSVSYACSMEPNEMIEAAVAEGNAVAPDEGDYILANLLGWGSSYGGGGFSFACTYTSTAEQEAQVDAAVDQAMASLNLASKDDYNKIKAIHDYIVNHIVYTLDGNIIRHSTYAAIVEGKAVCQGYASLFYRMCKEAGIPVRYITGTAGGGHAWNIVKLGDVWYNVDTTWDDPVSADGTQVLRYDYFLKSDMDFSDHVRDEGYKTSAFYAKYPMATVSYGESAPTKLNLKNNVNLSFSTVDGASLNTVSNGKPKILVFFSYGCGNSMNTLEQFSKSAWAKSGQVDVCAVDTNDGTKSQVTEFAEKYCSDGGVKVAYCTTGESSDAMWSYARAAGLGNRISWPLVVMLDKDNKVQFVTQGVLSEEKVNKVYLPLLIDGWAPTEDAVTNPIIFIKIRTFPGVKYIDTEYYDEKASGSTVELKVGDQYFLRGIGVPENRYLQSNTDTNFTIDTGNVITYDASTAVLNAVNPGTATLTFASVTNPEVKATIKFVVKAKETGNSGDEGSIAEPTPTPEPQDFPFGDVPKNSWKYEGIKYVYDNQIMKGVGDGTTFAPDDTLTRAMFATVLYRMAGEPAVTYTNKFPDVPAGKWYSNAIIWASKKGIVSGYGDGTFGKDNNITREQMAKMLMEFAKAEGYGTNIRADLNGYPDQSSISGWARDYMSWAVGSGMIGGKTVDGKLSLVPKGEATRAECATILMRFDKNF